MNVYRCENGKILRPPHYASDFFTFGDFRKWIEVEFKLSIISMKKRNYLKEWAYVNDDDGFTGPPWVVVVDTESRCTLFRVNII